ncbi:hypothetical protein CPC08DRAFT_150774 [Agrocybe pediades]|nr:hypothetical protein CPC08DRAFT_150774 [Agrocybe pediades]
MTSTVIQAPTAAPTIIQQEFKDRFEDRDYPSSATAVSRKHPRLSTFDTSKQGTEIHAISSYASIEPEKRTKLRAQRLHRHAPIHRRKWDVQNLWKSLLTVVTARPFLYLFRGLTLREGNWIYEGGSEADGCQFAVGIFEDKFQERTRLRSEIDGCKRIRLN